MDPLALRSYAREFSPIFDHLGNLTPWDAATDVAALIGPLASGLPESFERTGDVWKHASASIHPTAVITGPVVIDADAIVGPHVRLRGGVVLGRGCVVGPSTEVKSSWIFEKAALAHLNYVGNSVVGYDTNVEAGAVLANHFNERSNKAITVVVGGNQHATGLTKFGAAVGPDSRIGANAVTTPGTMLAAETIVGRLELVDQLADQLGSG